MFSWITGPRITNVIEDLQTEPAYENTLIEPPETPAHQFAVKAFKHALFGTPAPEDATNATKKLEKKAKLDAANSKAPNLPATKDASAPCSPSKRPGGILATPGTANKGRKTVSFGSQVIDNEEKRANTGKSGIPNECPGKFPSPWTPGTELKVDADKAKKPNSKLTAALLDARSTPQPRSTQKLKARDDSDITIDVTAPRSESGKYWKEQYESYADKSEREMKKLIAKQQLAKNFAKKKDGEMTEVSTRLAEERKRFRQRERELEQQNKDYQERLRQAMAENTAASVEITALKNRIAVLEKSFVEPSPEVQDKKPSFQIFEDQSKDLTPVRGNQQKVSISQTREVIESPSIILGRPVQTTRIPPGDKENSPPKPRRARRQTLPDASPRPTTTLAAAPETAADPFEISAMPPASRTTSTRVPQPFAKSTLTARTPDKSFLNVRKPEPTKVNLPPKSLAALPSSPLPLPSPDPWVGLADDSAVPHIDRLTFPIASGTSHSRPAEAYQSKPTHHRASKSVSRVKPETTVAPKTQVENTVRRGSRSNDRDIDPTMNLDKELKELKAPPKVAKSLAEVTVPKERKPEVTRTKSERAKGPDLVAKERVSSVDRNERELLPVDRKEQAKRRLAERRLKKIEA